MAEKKARRGTSQREAVEKIREGETFVVNLPGLGQVEIPRPEQLAYFGGLAALAALELIDWPVAVVIAAGTCWPAITTTRSSRSSGRRWRRCEGWRAVTARHEPAGIGPSAMPCGCRWG